MAKLREVIAYLCEHYPHKDELSNSRLTKLVYLADWRSSLVRGEQLTPIQWQFYHYGPYVDDIWKTASDDPGFTVANTFNQLGERKILIGLKGRPEYESLTEEDREILDHVIAKTAPLYWKAFMRLVYSTYPVATQQRYDVLDLPHLAEEARELGDLFSQEPA